MGVVAQVLAEMASNCHDADQSDDDADLLPDLLVRAMEGDSGLKDASQAAAGHQMAAMSGMNEDE